MPVIKAFCRPLFASNPPELRSKSISFSSWLAAAIRCPSSGTAMLCGHTSPPGIGIVRRTVSVFQHRSSRKHQRAEAGACRGESYPFVRAAVACHNLMGCFASTLARSWLSLSLSSQSRIERPLVVTARRLVFLKYQANREHASKIRIRDAGGKFQFDLPAAKYPFDKVMDVQRLLAMPPQSWSPQPLSPQGDHPSSTWGMTRAISKTTRVNVIIPPPSSGVRSASRVFPLQGNQKAHPRLYRFGKTLGRSGR